MLQSWHLIAGMRQRGSGEWITDASPYVAGMASSGIFVLLAQSLTAFCSYMKAQISESIGLARGIGKTDSAFHAIGLCIIQQISL